MNKKNLKMYQVLKGISLIAIFATGAYLISCADVIKRSGMFVNTAERSTYDTFDALIDTGYIKGIVAALIILCVSAIVYLYVTKRIRAIKHAMVRILRYYRIKPTEVHKSIKDKKEQIEYIIQPKGIMSRTVKLSEGWHKDSIGAMLGVLKEEGKTVALIPRRTKGYYYLSPVTGKKEKISGPCEDLFEEEALLFYPPLPLKQLTLQDIGRYMTQTLSEWDIALLFAVTAAATAVGLLLPVINKLVFGQVLSSANLRVLGAIGCFLISVTVCKAMMELIRTLFLDKMVLKMDIAIESATMMRMISLPASFFKKYSSGDLSRRLEYLGALYDTLAEVMLTSTVSSLFSLIYVIQIFIYARALFYQR